MSQDARQIIAKNIKLYRTQKKITREKLSLIINRDNSYISKLERGNINIPIDVLQKIADYFEVEVKDLLDFE